MPKIQKIPSSSTLLSWHGYLFHNLSPSQIFSGSFLTFGGKVAEHIRSSISLSTKCYRPGIKLKERDVLMSFDATDLFTRDFLLCGHLV